MPIGTKCLKFPFNHFKRKVDQCPTTVKKEILNPLPFLCQTKIAIVNGGSERRKVNAPKKAPGMRGTKTMPSIHIINKFEPNPHHGAVEVDTTSRGSFKDLSPFYLGPINYECPHYGTLSCLRFENLWQYCKVYTEHTVLIGDGRYTAEPQISHLYYEWRNRGFLNSKAIRYPMGKGKKPLFSLWGTQRLDYINARLKIYIPNYVHLVRQTKSYALLYKWFHEENRNLVLRDFDGYAYAEQGMTLQDVVHNTQHSMGHAFILAMMLKGELPQ